MWVSNSSDSICHAIRWRVFRLQSIRTTIWMTSAIFVMVSCGTMPVPDMPQAKRQTKEVITAKDSVNQIPVKTPLSTPEPSQQASAQQESSQQTPPVDSPTEEEKASVNNGNVGSNTADSDSDSDSDSGQRIQPPQSPLETKETGIASTTTEEESPSSNQELPIYQPAVNTIFPQKNIDVPQFPVITADERVQNAIAFLNQGNEFQAKKELSDALVIEPGNRSARKLMRILNDSSGIYFSQTEFFQYRVRPNETLIGVAKKFLDDPMEFYPLAKLNNIKIPADLVAGQILKIPGKQLLSGKSVQDAAIPPSKNIVREHKASEEEIKFERAKVYYSEHRYKEAIDLLTQAIGNKIPSENRSMRKLLAENYRDYSNLLIKKGNFSKAQSLLESSISILPENNELVTKLISVKKDREAERLYQLGMDEIKIGKDDLALKTLIKVLQLNPDHSQAKKQMADLKLSVIKSYHKKAMVLFRKQELSQAIQVWDEILQLDPNYDLAKQYRAKALELKRKIEQL